MNGRERIVFEGTRSLFEMRLEVVFISKISSRDSDSAYIEDLWGQAIAVSQFSFD